PFDVAAREEEERQMPAGPDDAEDHARAAEAEAGREAREGVAAPADLFARLPAGDDGEDRRADHQRPRLIAEARPRTRAEAVDDGDGELDRGDVAEGEEVPARADAPLEETAQQRGDSRAPVTPRRERQRDDGRCEDA